jgi:arylformamidase
MGTRRAQTIDLYRPETAVQGLTIIVHGGYWMRFSPDDFGFLAEGPLAHGQAVAMVRYTLAPDARIAAITAEVAALSPSQRRPWQGPIRLTGHSAGGHLVTRMVCARRAARCAGGADRPCRVCVGGA